MYYDPRHWEARRGRGEFYFWCRDWDRAILEFNICIDIHPRAVRVWTHRARCWIERGDWDRARHDLDRCREYNPRYWHQYYTRGMLHERRGQWQDADREYSRAVEHNPREWRAYQQRSLVRERLGRTTEAAKDLERAQQLNRGQRHASPEDRLSQWRGHGGEEARGGADRSTSPTREARRNPGSEAPASRQNPGTDRGESGPATRERGQESRASQRETLRFAQSDVVRHSRRTSP